MSPRRRPPTLEALRALLMLADTGTISETARRLGVSQPVVTKKLEVFKDSLACGAVLLRSEGKAALTESAQSVLPAIRELVRRYDRLLGFLSGAETAPQVIRIGTGAFAAEHYLPRVLAELRSTLHDCQIETRVCRGRERIVGTAQGTFDLSIVTHDAAQIRQILRDERLPADVLTITPLSRHPVGLVAARRTSAGADLERYAAEPSVPVTQLKRWELIGPDRQSGLRRQLEGRFAPGELYFVVEGGGWTAAKEYARVGLGVAVVPLGTVTAGDEKDLVCRRLSQEFAIEDLLLCRRDEESQVMGQVVKVMIATVRAAIGRSI